jgi:hypothetical protein
MEGNNPKIEKMGQNGHSEMKIYHQKFKQHGVQKKA